MTSMVPCDYCSDGVPGAVPVGAGGPALLPLQQGRRLQGGRDGGSDVGDDHDDATSGMITRAGAAASPPAPTMTVMAATHIAETMMTWRHGTVSSVTA